VHPALYREIQELPWVKDGLSETERETIDELLYIGAGDIANLKAVLGLTWVQDGISETEYNAIDYLSGLENKLEKAAASIIAMPWFQDGVTETEKDAVVEFYGVAYSNSDAAAALIALPWFQDSITETEKDAVRGLSGIADKNSDAAAALIAMPWFQDSVTETEKDTVVKLYKVAYSNSDAAAALIAMPFLESLEYDDVLAIQGMRRLAHDGLLSVLIETPAWESGFTNADTTLAAAAGTLNDRQEISRMLSPGYAAIETFTSETERTPNLKISIVRTGTQPQSWTAEGVREAVEFAERTMQLPLPVSHVIAVLNDHAVTGSAAGTNHGHAFGYLPKYEQGQDPYDRHIFQAGIVHEVAHHFWRGNEDWIDEGLANIIEYMHGVESGISPGFLKNQRRDCEVHDLEALASRNPGQDSPDFRCNYYLGQNLFQELLEALGEAEFKKRLQELYQLSLAEQEEQRTPGIKEVRQVFQNQADIINKHWNGKLNAPENRPYDDMAGVVSHDLVDWEQYPTYDRGTVKLQGKLLHGAVFQDVDLKNPGGGKSYYADYLISLASRLDYKGVILPQGRWILDPEDTEASTHHYYPATDTFILEFPFPKVLGNPTDYAVVVLGFPNKRVRDSAGEGEQDILGYARIRTE
jgi:hypothetical protein